MTSPHHCLAKAFLYAATGMITGITSTVPWIAERELIGHWDGTIGEGRSIRQFHVLFKQVPEPLASSFRKELVLGAVIDIPHQGIKDVEAKEVRFHSPIVYFQVFAGAGNLRACAGELGHQNPGARSDRVETTDQISGTCTTGYTEETFLLHRRTAP
jgi:hypothetical protein